MKRTSTTVLLLVSFLLFSGLSTFAQSSGGAGRGGRQIPAIGHFYGRIVDTKTHKGIEGVSVELSLTDNDKDSVVGGLVTSRNGDFSFNNLPLRGSYELTFSAVGYKMLTQDVSFDLRAAKAMSEEQRATAFEKDLGNIKLETDPETLNQVVVTGSKPLMQLGIDRKVYNVEKDIAAQGGTAVDVMKNIPSLAVDIDGNVTYRNASPTIFVDGRPTTLTLDQIPSDAIETVEIISNPGAKYDASGGTSGILNVVLKKNRKAGYNGTAQAGVDKRGGYNFGGNLNVKQGKFNVFAGGNFRERKTYSPGTTDRYTTLGDPEYKLHQVDDNVNKGYFAFGRLGLDYLMDNRNTFSVSGTLVHGSFKPTTSSDLTLDSLFENGYTNTSFTHRDATTNGTWDNKQAQFSYKHTFPKAGEEWTADANYSKGTNTNLNNTTSYLYNTPGGPLSSTYRQQQNSGGTNEYITAQTDYVNPFSDKSKLEAGARIATRNVDSRNIGSTFDENGNETFQPLLSSSYDYYDRVIAGYVTYSNKIGKLGYQVGLRAESSSYKGSSAFATNDEAHPGDLKDTTGNFSNNYPISLFPSFYLSYQASDNDQFQLNYTRRVDRPGFFQLFPYVDYSDSLNLSMGNPDLKPQFTNSIELNYQKLYGASNNFMASIYYKYTTDLITRYQQKGVNPLTDSTVLINTYINANSSYVGGLELIGTNTLTPWWSLTSNLNIFTSKINAADSIQASDATYSWFGKLNTTFKLPKNFTLQITGNYVSKTVLPPGGSAGGSGGRGWGATVSGNAQGYSKPTGSVDAALKFEFLKNKAANITLSIDDIFKTRRSDVVMNSEYSQQETYRIRDPQFVRLQFHYRFGKFDSSLFKRKNNRNNDQDNIPNGPEGAGS
ncbi:MAG TPA: outer membrane beta-barrel family protein [Puia sp.]|nr:outer membrane beta-barrel family protein [Puia sp.]